MEGTLYTPKNLRKKINKNIKKFSPEMGGR